MAFLDIINTYAKIDIVPGVVDNVFKHSALLSYVKKNNIERFSGGSQIQENIRYAGLIGEFYAKGQQFDVSKKQTATGMTFTLRHLEVGVTEFLEDINIFVKGPNAPFKLVEDDLNNAADTMAAYLAIAMYQNGTRAGFTLMLNGLAEVVSDGTTNSWDSNTYTTYGTLTRSGTVTPALNGKVTNVNGAITYNTLEDTYNQTVIGSEHPNLGVTTNKGMTYVRQRFQPQQRIEGVDPNVGFVGLKFNAATIVQDQYAPGSGISAATDPIVSALMTKMGLTYPTLTTESFWWLNTKYFKLYVTDDPLFGFGFTGFKRSVDTTTVAGQYLFAGNLVCTGPRYQHQLYGIAR